MTVDLAFELSYLLSDILGREVRVESYRFDPGTGRLCVALEGSGGEACTLVRACKGLAPGRAERCIAKALAQGGRPLEELVSAVERLLGQG